MSKVYIIAFRVTPLAQSIMPPEFSGAYVSCYSFGNDYVEATKKALIRLSKDGLHPQEILQPVHEMESKDWVEHVNEKWSSYVDSLPSQMEFDLAMESDQVVYGPFGSYS